MTSRLEDEALAFAARLQALLRGTVAPTAPVTARTIPNSPVGERAVVGPPEELIELPTHGHGQGSLHLRLQFTVQMDPEGEHLAVATSVFGLCVNADTRRCPIRVEYDRHKEHRQAAHIQVDADSPLLKRAYTAAGTRPQHMSKLHIPAGHRRFRPSLEDFIEFLHQEGLIRNMRPNWHQHLEASRAGWEARQLRAAVRRDPVTAALQLADEGYLVVPLRQIKQRAQAGLRPRLSALLRLARRR